MVCIYCGGETQVVNSRHQIRSNQVWRRRRCKSCQNVFTSLESPDLATSILFVSKQGQLEPFRRDELFLSIYNALGHRKDATEAAAALSGTVISKINPKVANTKVSYAAILVVTTEVLRRFDKTAATVYKAYHPIK